MGRLVQRGPAILIPGGRIGPAFDKRSDGLRMASTGRLVQRGLAISPGWPDRPRL